MLVSASVNVAVLDDPCNVAIYAKSELKGHVAAIRQATSLSNV